VQLNREPMVKGSPHGELSRPPQIAGIQSKHLLSASNRYNHCNI